MKIYYFIVPVESLTQEMVDRAIEDNAYTLRENITKDKVILKYASNKIPLSLKQLGILPLDFSEIVEELDKPEWAEAQ